MSLADIGNRRHQLGADAASRHPVNPPSLLQLPGEPVPLDQAPQDNVDSDVTASELCYRLLHGLCHQPAADDHSLECDMVSTGIAALESIPFVSLDDLRTSTASDPSMKDLHDQVLLGFPADLRSLTPCLRPYGRYSESYCVFDGVVMSELRIVVPPALRGVILHGLHAAHQCVPAM